ncbi:hypothetical protein ACN20G_35395 (plasmid) [Streptomyces sp. BI20]|uniref:hypothetical protein n=1 Tax=Streptomyces sp. BI20 TaxID=3403460 RepID=UPI003C761454
MRPAEVWELTARVAHGVTVAAAGLHREQVVEKVVEAREAAVAARPAVEPWRVERTARRRALITRVRWEEWQRIDALLVEAGEGAVYEPGADEVAAGYAAEVAKADARRRVPDLIPPFRTGPLRVDVVVPEPAASAVRAVAERTGRREDELLQELVGRLVVGPDGELVLGPGHP